MDDYGDDSKDVYNIVKFVLDLGLSLPVIDFILSIDVHLAQNLPNRLDHLLKIVKQAYSVDIEPHRMFDLLALIKQPSTDGKNILQHNKNIEHEINKYTSDAWNLCNFPQSTSFCSSFTLEPKSDRCPQCEKSLSASPRFKNVTLYLADGSSKTATVVSYICKSNQCALELFPNFIVNLSEDDSYCFTNNTFFSNGKYVYLGGRAAFECLMLDQYSSLLTNGHVAFDSFTRSFNELSQGSQNQLDRRLFERVFIIYKLIHYQLFMGIGEKFLSEGCAFFPRNIYTDLDNFIMNNYDRFYKIFVEFWSSHNTFHPCKSTKRNGESKGLCSAAIICDGHMKIRRRVCANPDVALSLPRHFVDLFKPLIVGCSHTPIVNEILCVECKMNGVSVERFTSRTKNKRQKIREKSESIQNNTNDMLTLGCNVHKEDVLSDGSIRACGILVVATNCQVIIGFEEILRSESRKQVIQTLANLYGISPMLSRIVIYDAGCLLAKSFRTNFTDEKISLDVKTNIGFQALKEVRFFVDRFHLSNHKEKYCHTELNLDCYEEFKHINSSSCEQINAWVKSYSHILSNMNEYRFGAILLILFHSRNCLRTNISCRCVDARQLLTAANNS